MKNLLFTIKQFAAKHDAFPENNLRGKILKSNNNGLLESGAVIKDGKRILIHEEFFFLWLYQRSLSVGWGKIDGGSK